MAGKVSTHSAWSTVQLSDVAEHTLGKMLDAQKNKGRPLPYLRNPNIRWFDVDTSNLSTMLFEPREDDRYGLLAGDVVICEGGEAGRAAIWDGRRTDVKFQKAVHRVRPGPSLDARFLVYRLRMDYQSGRLADYYTGATIKHLTGQDLARYSFPLPPILEQRRIVEALDRAEALRAKRRAALAQLDTMSQSIFLEMFGAGAQAPVTLSDSLPEHPKGWRWELLTDVAKLATGHTPDRERADYWGGDIPWISLTDIRHLDGTVSEKTLQYVTSEGIENSSSVCLPQGTVCFSRTASIGFVTIMGREMATSQDFVNWVPGPRLEPRYLMWALIRSRPQLRAISAGSTHKTIYVRVVENLRALLPPIELQREFSRRIELVDGLKAASRLALAELDLLFAALQYRAFRGEL